MHWHGLDVPNSVDSVGGVTQDPISPGQTSTYEFTVPDQHGTFMYHSHMDDYKQISNCMFKPRGGLQRGHDGSGPGGQGHRVTVAFAPLSPYTVSS